MKLLLVSDLSYGGLGTSYLNAFKSTDIGIYSYDIENDLKNLNLITRNRYSNRILGRLFLKELNLKLITKVKEIKPDYIFIIKGTLVHPETIKEIKLLNKSIVFCFNPDNPFNLNCGASNDLIRKSIPLYDYYFIWGRFLIPELKKVGAKNIQYLAFGYDQTLHYPIETKEKDFYTSDISFIGTWENEREYWLSFLKDYDLAIWGDSWQRIKFLSPLKGRWKKQPVYGESFSRICNSSKIAINLIRKQNGNAHNMRTFEIPACKGFMLSTRTNEQLGFFQEDKEAAYFDSPEELKEKANYYLKHTERALEIARNAREQVIKEHSYEHRVKQILKVLI